MIEPLVLVLNTDPKFRLKAKVSWVPMPNPKMEIIETIKANLLTVYPPGIWVTVDEHLYSYRGWFFRQFTPSKPARYGIRIYVLADSVD